MKKYILDKDTNKLIPWSQFIHDKEQTNVKKEEKEEERQTETRKLEDSEIAEDIIKREADIYKRQLSPVNEEADAKVPDLTEKVDDKVVLSSGKSGPPGNRKESKVKKGIKRKFQGPKLQIENKDNVDSPAHKKRVWISL